MTHNIKVNNVQCDSCVDTIKSELEKLEGITSVSYNKNELRLTIEGSADRDISTKMLAELGYPEKK